MIGCKKSILAVLLAVVLALPLMPLSTAEAASSVRVNLPYFPVKINGQTMDPTHSQYPFLYYKDVTYLPLTWNNLQTLGLRYGWSEEEGLWIQPNLDYPPPVVETPPAQDLMEGTNSDQVYTAQVAQGPIRIGAASIDNLNEPYPFLTFRDVTYMPLTWHFVHNLLQLDIRWNEGEGLHVIGGQRVLGSVLGEDDEALYFDSMYYADPQKRMIRMDKTDFGLQWKSEKEEEALRTDLLSKDVPYAGKPAKLLRKDRELYYGDVKLYTFTDGDLYESDTWGAPVHTYKEYAAGEGAVIITVNLRISIAATMPMYGTTYTFLVRGGQVTKLEEFQNQRIGRVIPNHDGTVWIASNRLPIRSSFIPGSARLGLLDEDGKVHMVNEGIGKSDVLTLGLNNPMLDNPADQKGSLHIAVYGDYEPNTRDQPVEGVYTINTKLETTLISDQTQGEFYLDRNRNIFVLHGNNTRYTLDLSEMDMTKAVYNAVFQFYEDFKSRGIEPVVELSESRLMVQGNAEALHRIFQNILKNALVHGSGGIRILLRTEGDAVLFSCSNTVENPAEMDMTKVFTRFYKADSARTHSSTGLGLSIAKGLVERMDGDISAELEQGVFSVQVSMPRDNSRPNKNLNSKKQK